MKIKLSFFQPINGQCSTRIETKTLFVMRLDGSE